MEEKTLWDDVAHSLVSELEKHLPGRSFDACITREHKKVIREIDPVTSNFIANLLEYRESKNTIGIFKSFSNKSDYFIARYVMDKTSEELGVRREPGRFGDFFPTHSYKEFPFDTPDEALSFIRDTLYFVYTKIRNVPDLYFNLNHTGSVFSCHTGGFNFHLQYFLTPTHLEFRMYQDINKESDTTAFSFPYGEFDDLERVLQNKITEFRMMNLFSNNSYSFLANEIQSKFFPVWKFNSSTVSLTLTQRLLHELSNTLQLKPEELELLHLKSVNIPQKKYIRFGDYRLSRFIKTEKDIGCFLCDTENLKITFSRDPVEESEHTIPLLLYKF